MATVYSSTNDGYVYRTASSWTSSRNGATGTSYNSTLTSNAQAISASRFSARGGGYSYTIYRTFLHFDTSGISGTVTDATLKIRGRTFNTGDVIALKATSGIATLTAADYDNIEGWIMQIVMEVVEEIMKVVLLNIQQKYQLGVCQDIMISH